MDNIDPKTVELQQKVVDKFNVNKYPHYAVKANFRHGAFIDYFWGMNSVEVSTFKGQSIPPKFTHDVILILDIDCIPLSERAIDLYLQEAMKGKIVGNAQRSNHIENNQHVFAAPSATAITKETFKKIGCPSALETSRSDVLEEYTWAAEAAGVQVDKYMPLRFDQAPQRYEWEKDQPPYWPLADGMPVYGIGTTYGDEIGDLYYHNFQIRIPGSQEKFQAKCEEVLKS